MPKLESVQVTSVDLLRLFAVHFFFFNVFICLFVLLVVLVFPSNTTSKSVAIKKDN